ncbi:MAG: hypothetical protein ABIG30_03590 [Candidatus Aenigmatarchaeota archaeon]
MNELQTFEFTKKIFRAISPWDIKLLAFRFYSFGIKNPRIYYTSNCTIEVSAEDKRLQSFMEACGYKISEFSKVTI